MMNVKMSKKKKNKAVVVENERLVAFANNMSVVEQNFNSKYVNSDKGTILRAYVRELRKLCEEVQDKELLIEYIKLKSKELYRDYREVTLVHNPDGLAGVDENFYYTPSGREEHTWKDNFIDYGSSVDYKLARDLWHIINTLIVSEKALLIPEIEDWTSFLYRVTKAENVPAGTNAKLISIKNKLNAYMSDEGFVEYAKKYGDAILYTATSRTEEVVLGADRKMLIDYLETYKRLYRTIGIDYTTTAIWNYYMEDFNLQDMLPEDAEIRAWRKRYDEEGIEELQENAMVYFMCTTSNVTEVPVVMSETEKVQLTLNKGDKIKHVHFGIGEVIEVSNDNSIVTVKFENSTKKLAAKFEGYKGVMSKI